MKMSDVFALPVVGAAVHVNIFQLKGNYNDGGTPFELIDNAVNNHDKLTEENKRLSKQLTIITAQRDELVKDVTFVMETFKSDLQAGYKTRDKEFAVDILSNALSKIKEQTND